MIILKEEEKGLTVNQISETLAIAPSTVTRFVDKLVAKGYVKREKAGKNSFSKITEEGLKIIPDIYKAWDGISEKIEEIIGNEEYLRRMGEDFKEFTKNTYIATNSGRVGHKGFITEILKDDYDVIYCCGPNPMMNSVKNLGFDIPVYVSLESRMGCGIGACLACSCKTKSGMQRICKEGPIFEVKEVDF